MRCAWLMLVVVVPAAAQEYLVNLTGSTTTGSPVTASFDINAVPIALNLDPFDCQFGGILSVTNLSVTVGGRALFATLSRTQASFNGFPNPGPQPCVELMHQDFSAGSANDSLFFNLETPEVRFTDSKDPILAILTSWQNGTPEGGSIDPGDIGLDNFKLTVQAVAAPEPGTLALMALGLLGIATRTRRSRFWRR